MFNDRECYVASYRRNGAGGQGQSLCLQDTGRVGREGAGAKMERRNDAKDAETQKTQRRKGAKAQRRKDFCVRLVD